MNKQIICSAIKNTVFKFLVIIQLLSLLGCGSDDSQKDSNQDDSSQSTVSAPLTDSSFDLAVNGRGYLYFDNRGSDLYRRSSTVTLDTSGFIVTEDGHFLQGFSADDGRISGVLTDLEIPDIDPTSIDINEQGLIFSMQNGEQTIHGKIALANFASPYQLTEVSPGLFTGNIDTGGTIIGEPETASLGAISIDNAPVPDADYTLELSAADNSYFVLADGENTVYAPSVLLFSDKNGFIIDDFSNRLVAYAELDGGAVTGKETIDLDNFVSLQLNGSDLPPKASDAVTLEINLNSQDLPAAGVFDHLDASTYNVSYEISLYDSLGYAYDFKLFFTHTEAENEWQMNYLFMGPESMENHQQVGGPYTLLFDDQGSLISDQLKVQSEFLENRYSGASDIGVIEIDISAVTHTPEAYTANIQQDGYLTGRYNGLLVENCGRVVFSYNNNIDFVYGQLGLASFPNPAGLTLNSDGLFMATQASGAPIIGTPCSDGISEIMGDDKD